MAKTYTERRLEFRNSYLSDASKSFWNKLITKFVKDTQFPTERLDELIRAGSREVKTSDAMHKGEGRESHAVKVYEFYEPLQGTMNYFGISYIFGYCPECKKVARREAYLLNNIENLAFLKKFI